jgi:hypothetical protein
MGSSIRLGRIAGIDLGLNWGFLAAFVLIVLGRASPSWRGRGG